MSDFRVLLVEDERLNRELMTTVLGSNAFEVTVAKDGLEACKKAMADGFDIVVLDIMLPDISGLEVARRLRADPNTAKVPIVAVTANAMESDANSCYEAGCDAWIPKPFNVHTFPAALKDIIRDYNRK